MLASPEVRFYLTGRIVVEGRQLLDQAELPGRQGRLALVYLVARRHRPVRVEELAEALWGQSLPRSWEPSLRAVVSKLRSALDGVGAGGLRRDGGCYHALLGSAWVDLEAAANAVDRAEGARRNHDAETAWSEATVAASITARPLLDGEDLPWVHDLRMELDGLAVRALDVLCEVNLARGDHRLAATAARRLISLAPFREAGYRHLMRAEAAAGDPAEALQVYRRLRVLLAEELGSTPSPPTQSVFSELLELGTTNGTGPVTSPTAPAEHDRR
jgi:SARP family transcriptional regulator, regulator of embCAB operon